MGGLILLVIFLLVFLAILYWATSRSTNYE